MTKAKTLSLLLLTLGGLGWMISRSAQAATPDTSTGTGGGYWPDYDDQWSVFDGWQYQYQEPDTVTDNSNAPRGIRNHNPGNIRHGDSWQGMAEVQTDSEYIQFTSPEWGIRAAGKLLLNYEHLYGLNTVAGIIGRWAPTVENDTGAYVTHVAERLGVGENQPLNVASVLPQLVEAIIVHENGIQPYSADTIRAGLALI